MKDEMDILKEASSISAGQASIALSEIIGRRINLTMPSLQVIDSAEISKKILPDRIVLSINSHILSGLKGDILFILKEESAFKLIDLCYKSQKDAVKTGVITEMGMSIIKEVGNIVISSYVGALSVLLKRVVIPSVFTLISGPIEQIVKMTLRAYTEKAYLILIEAAFEEPKDHIKGSFYLILTQEAMDEIQEACKKSLESL
jgi:chemotaxis protein CheC